MKKRIKFIEQMQQTECGLCCVAMIMNYFGCGVSINDLRVQNDIGREGSSIIQLKNILNKYDLNAKVYETRIEGLMSIKEPVILFWENRHYVILKKINRKRAIVIDPEYGTITYSLHELESYFCNFVIICQPEKVKKSEKDKEHIGKEFIPIIMKNKYLYITIFICSLITYAGSLGFPIIIQKLVDSMSKEQMLNNIPKVFGVAIVYILFEFFKNYYQIRLQANIDEDINNHMFYKLLKLPYKYFDMRNKSDIMVSMSSGMVVRDVIVHQIINGIVECGAAIVIIVYMFVENILLAIISTVVFGVLIIIMICMQYVLKDRGMSLIVSQKKLQEVQTETIFSMLNVKMLSLENVIKKNWDDRFNVYKKNYIRRENLGNLLNNCVFAIVNVVPVVLLIIGLLLTWDNKMTLGKTLAFYSLSGTFFSLAGSICAMFISIINSTTYIDRVADIIKQKDEYRKNNGKRVEIEGEVLLENVSYQYSKNSEEVLSNINLHINKGEKVAIVGKSGSGKSTLAKILIGLYKPNIGNVYFDNINIEEINSDVIYEQVGIVPQEISLFNKSIFENIVANRENITFDDVVEISKMVGIHDDIEKMPMKYNTIISEMGTNLSGGQRQRIALARALVGNIKILVLDEATSALDNIYEKRLSENLKEVEITRIVIAHRMSTIYDADKIVVMDDGTIVEEGTHSELLEKNGLYKSLYLSEDNIRIK